MIEVAVLAGGRSRRMGQDKVFVPFHGQPMLGHVLSMVQSRGLLPMVIGRTRDELVAGGLDLDGSIPCVPDDFPGQGPVGGLATGLRCCRRSILIVMPCDVPNATAASLDWLLWQVQGQMRSEDNLPGADTAWAVVPFFDGRAEPLFAVYSKAVLQPAMALLANPPASMGRLLESIDTRRVEMEQDYAGAVMDVDTPEELEAAQRSKPVIS